MYDSTETKINRRRRWTIEEDNILIECIKNKETRFQISKKLSRTMSVITGRKTYLKKKFKI